MTRLRIAVAGSGLAGLHTAVTLSDSADVTVYERLPVPGGEHWEDPEHRRMVRRAHRNGVRFRAGTQVIRWEGDQLLAIGEHGGVMAADSLVVATGHRPSTRTELGINGDRCAGVVPATLALHLLKQQVHLGDNVVVATGSHWSDECIAELGPATSVVAIDAGTRLVATHGMPRITGVSIESASGITYLECDCLILGTAPVPYRNIDGAILDDAPAVYAQRVADEHEPPGRLGIRAAHQALAHANNQLTHTPVTPRIGLPQ
ncbi:NAD(P)/FAD-dependent oxidoreductase [Mycobacterium sp. 21AC1]|uniref:FAD-dependent oxidoreductase n=1 Tax=[Mycobacterium] appelbergii TaxID=2939269 RepID=UPI0029394D6B|nr:FAD-dependent oxidoreductase [Mycobacterium sp. 21AC1]MDV3125876.1 NAD(P)/FAD-dependent oxidoreductase [Mycobacterium sp. 21AC1]